MAETTAAVRFRADVEVRDGSPSVWYSNGLRFDTFEEASDYVVDLASRWTLVVRGRVVEETTPDKEAVDPDDPSIVVSFA